jgi:hypothetical protein
MYTLMILLDNWSPCRDLSDEVLNYVLANFPNLRGGSREVKK